MALLMAETTDLANTLDRWIKDQKLTVASLARLAFVSRRTIYNALGGELITEDTLRKIARGLATHPHSGDLDKAVQAEALRDLFVAAGFEPPDDEVQVVDLDDELLRRLQKRTTANEFREVLDRWPSLSPARKRLLEAAFRAALED